MAPIWRGPLENWQLRKRGASSGAVLLRQGKNCKQNSAAVGFSGIEGNAAKPPKRCYPERSRRTCPQCYSVAGVASPTCVTFCRHWEVSAPPKSRSRFARDDIAMSGDCITRGAPIYRAILGRPISFLRPGWRRAADNWFRRRSPFRTREHCRASPVIQNAS